MKANGFRIFKNDLFRLMIWAMSIMVLIPLFLIAGTLIQKGAGSLSWSFFTETAKPLGEEGGGMLHALLGTLLMVVAGACIAIPWGILAGIALAENPNSKLSVITRTTIDVLSGVPSIVVGIFVYLLLVVPFKSFSTLAGGIALAIIMLPVVTKTSEEVIRLIPKTIKEAGIALGLPYWKVLFYIILRAAKNGLITGIVLALARASGETAPLLFTAFGNMYLNFNPLAPSASLPLQIYLYAISPYEEWHRLAWSGALVLILVVFSLNLLARYITRTKKG